MRIGCHLSVSKGFLAMGRTALDIGANTFQFFTRNPRGGAAKAVDMEDLAAFETLAAEQNICSVLGHAAYTLNPCSADPKTRNFALTAMTEDLKRMDLLSDSIYVFHPGSHVGQGLEMGISLIASQLNTVLTPETRTTVLLETMAGKGSEVGGRFEELREILDRVQYPQKMGVCLDTCHVHDAGYDMAGDLDGVLTEFDRVIGLGNLRAVHLNDSLNPLGSRKDRHAVIGGGHLGLAALTRIINHPQLRQLPFYLETPNDLHGYAKEIALLREVRHY